MSRERDPFDGDGPDAVTAHDLVSDGGGAAILVGAERAKDFPSPPAYLLGIGVATTHDQFLAMPDLTVLAMEDLGFCAKGEGGPFVASGVIAPGGRLPVDTNGGLSCVHPGQYGLFTITEAVRQIRGEAGDRQVEGARVALCNGNGGVLSSQVTALLGAADTV